MPNRRVALIRAVKIDGKWKYLSPVVSDKGTVSPEFVWLKGKKTYASGGVWYIRWYEGKRQIGKMCGPSLTDARIAKSRQEQVLSRWSARHLGRIQPIATTPRQRRRSSPQPFASSPAVGST